MPSTISSSWSRNFGDSDAGLLVPQCLVFIKISSKFITDRCHIAGSIESSSITPSFAFETSLANPHDSPIGSPHQTPFTANPPDPTPLADSDTAPTPSNHATPEPDSPVAQARHDESDISDPSSDEDAEGEEDDDYEENQPAPRSASPESATSQTQSHSDASSRSQKRKRSQDEEYDYIQANPELYGMRRSVSYAAVFTMYRHADNRD